MVLRRFLSTLLLTGYALNAASALAQDDVATRAARARFNEGVEYFDKGQFENARAAFLQAYALRKHPAVLLNLAQSSLKSGHALEAARYFQQFLREAQGISPAQRDSAQGGLAEARARLGHIEVSAPAGSEIHVDNDRTGSTPLPDAVDVEAGSHSVRARLPDGREESQSILVREGQRATARFAAAPPPPAPVPVVAPAPAPATTASTPTPPPATAAPPATASSHGLLSPPKTMVPVYVGAGLAVVGLGTAIAFGIAKGQAQTNADDVEEAIRANGGGKGTCSSTDPTVKREFGQACQVLTDNRAVVDTDATLANIGIAAAVVGVGLAGGWYLFGPKREDGTTSGLLLPWWQPGVGGASYRTTF